MESARAESRSVLKKDLEVERQVIRILATLVLIGSLSGCSTRSETAQAPETFVGFSLDTGSSARRARTFVEILQIDHANDVVIYGTRAQLIALLENCSSPGWVCYKDSHWEYAVPRQKSAQDRWVYDGVEYNVLWRHF